MGRLPLPTSHPAAGRKTVLSQDTPELSKHKAASGHDCSHQLQLKQIPATEMVTGYVTPGRLLSL